MKKMYALVMVATLAMPLFAADGAATFKAKCAGCHGADGTKTIPAMGVPAINTPAVKAKGAAGLTTIVAKGQGKMPAFAGKLSDDEISSVVKFVLTLK
jgi:mono/diheme cytochrome c family protein